MTTNSPQPEAHAHAPVPAARSFDLHGLKGPERIQPDPSQVASHVRFASHEIVCEVHVHVAATCLDGNLLSTAAFVMASAQHLFAEIESFYRTSRPLADAGSRLESFHAVGEAVAAARPTGHVGDDASQRNDPDVDTDVAVADSFDARTRVLAADADANTPSVSRAERLAEAKTQGLERLYREVVPDRAVTIGVAALTAVGGVSFAVTDRYATLIGAIRSVLKLLH